MNKKKNFWTILMALVVVLILALSMFTFTVQEGSQAVVYTFGKITETKETPGINFRWPIGIQKITTVDTRERILSVRGNEPVTTRDQNQIYLTLSLNWKVQDAKQFIMSMTSNGVLTIEEKASEHLQDKVRSARQLVTNQVALSEIITPDKGQTENFQQFEQKILKRVQEEVERSDYGIEVTSLDITSINFAKNSSKPIFDNMIAERKTRSEKNITDGKTEAMNIITRAEFEKQKLINQAEADARRIRGEGDAASAEFYKVFKKNPQLANFLRRLDTLEQILNKKSTIALPSNNPLATLIEQPPAVKSE